MEPTHLEYIIYYRLVYIKVVDMWNVTKILAYHTPENPGDTTIRVKADGPLGIAAIYVYDSTDVTPLPPAAIAPRGRSSASRELQGMGRRKRLQKQRCRRQDDADKNLRDVRRKM
jgi:hypothetical protein